MKKETCLYCCNNFSHGIFKKHIDNCKSNPGNQRDCPVCNKSFFYKKSGKFKKTCSHSCANKYFRSGENHPLKKIKIQKIMDGKYMPKGNSEKYKWICFQNHKKECVVCGENIVVEVHHLDGNNKNNNPENLIPLCRNHHHYWHSKHKFLIEEIVLDYISTWRMQNV